MEMYEQKSKLPNYDNDPVMDLEYTMGKLRCLHALGEWEELMRLVQGKWYHVDKVTKRKMAPLAAAAAWNLGQWDAMGECISAIGTDTVGLSLPIIAYMMIRPFPPSPSPPHIQIHLFIEPKKKKLNNESIQNRSKALFSEPY